jgi:hypothetical protein
MNWGFWLQDELFLECPAGERSVWLGDEAGVLAGRCGELILDDELAAGQPVGLGVGVIRTVTAERNGRSRW